MKNLFSDDNSGYRLKTLEIMNWGVFGNNEVKTFEFDGKSTLITGYNGTGKTTAVDAILTLLVPTNIRFYNLSSEAAKRERDVANYILGAYGNSGDGVKYLRDKNTVSIINGIFFDPTEDKYITLLQVRYFVSEKIVSIFAITELQLDFFTAHSAITKKGFSITSDGKWKEVLGTDFSTRFFKSFTEYKSFFMDRFGFRSDNALKIFSQTVGMKVLGDITTFVRNYMLEDKSPTKDFQRLDEEFNSLLSIEKEIEKAQLKLDCLKRINEFGIKWNDENNTKQRLSSLQKGESRWYRENYTSLCYSEIRKKNFELQNLVSEKEDTEARILHCESKLSELQNGFDTSFYDSLKHELDINNDKLKRAIFEYEKVALLYKDVNSKGIKLELPSNKDVFFKNLTNIPKIISEKKEDKVKLEKQRDEYSFSLKNCNEKYEKKKAELKYYSERNTNIPLENDTVRNIISKETGIPVSRLPYLGELISVSEESDKWLSPLTSLLNSIALTLLVERQDERVLMEYLNSNDMKCKVEVAVMEDSPLLSNNDSSILSFIKIKEKDNPYSKWLKEFLTKHVTHSLADDLESFQSTDASLTPSGLWRNGINTFKDDRKTDTDEPLCFLGWDNTKKRESIQNYLISLEIQMKDARCNLDLLNKNIDETLSLLSTLESILSNSSWDTIDKFSAEERVMETKERIDEYLRTNKELEERNKLIEVEKERKASIQNQLYDLIAKEAILKRSIEDLNRKLAKIKTEITDEDQERFHLDLFSTEYKEIIKNCTLENIEEIHNSASNKIGIKFSETEKKEISLRNELEKLMDKFINPSMQKGDEHLSWKGEYQDLVPEAQYLSDFQSEYQKVSENNLPELQVKFNTYFRNTLSQNVGTLVESIRNWDKEIQVAIKILNRNLMKIPFNKTTHSFLSLELKHSIDNDQKEFKRRLEEITPNINEVVAGSEERRKEVYSNIKAFLEKYRNDDSLRSRVLDIRRNYKFSAKEINGDGYVRVYNDTSSLSGGEKAKLTYTILASSIAYQFNLDNEDQKKKGPFRFVILDEAFSKSDSKNSEYALQLFKELDLQLMVITPRNGINLVEGYVSSLHLLEKNENHMSSLHSITIEEYKRA